MTDRRRLLFCSGFYNRSGDSTGPKQSIRALARALFDEYGIYMLEMATPAGQRIGSVPLESRFEWPALLQVTQKIRLCADIRDHTSRAYYHLKIVKNPRLTS